MSVTDDVLRVHYWADVLTSDYAARFAGYHLAALRLAAADPDAAHDDAGRMVDEVGMDGLELFTTVGCKVYWRE